MRKIVDEIMAKIESDLKFVPEPEKNKRIEAAVDYGAWRWPIKSG